VLACPEAERQCKKGLQDRPNECDPHDSPPAAKVKGCGIRIDPEHYHLLGPEPFCVREKNATPLFVAGQRPIAINDFLPALNKCS